MKNKKGLALSILVCFFIFGVTIPLFMSSHKKVKAETITNLTNTTWIINDEPAKFPGGRNFTDYYNNETDGPYNINFTSNSINFSSITFKSVEDEYCKMRYNVNSSNVYDVLTYGDNGYSWANSNYKTIVITGGTDVTNTTLINWLQNYATENTPTPTGTEITHRYWAPDGIITLTDNQQVLDENIQYTILYNEFNDSYEGTTQTGLNIYNGYNDSLDLPWSYINSNNNSLYNGASNNINNAMWLEFTPGDFMDTDLYDFLTLWGTWFDDQGAYLAGMNQGYAEGLQNGRALGQADGTQYTGLVTGIFNGLGGLLSIQVFPNITIGLIIGLPLLLGAFVIILKILRG